VKKKRPEREERRRPLVEINLVADAKSRSANIARRGCALFSLLVAVIAASAAAFLGLH
jgi:hypothetical protein